MSKFMARRSKGKEEAIFSEPGQGNPMRRGLEIQVYLEEVSPGLGQRRFRSNLAGSFGRQTSRDVEKRQKAVP